MTRRSQPDREITAAGGPLSGDAAPCPDRSQSILHASCVALDRRAVLLTGASGAGKSGLSLALMAMGAALVSDDRTVLKRRGEALVASAPPAIAGKIEARGVGILPVDAAGPTPVCLVVDLDREETDRLPPTRTIALMGCTIPLLYNVKAAHFPPAILHYLKASSREQ